MVTTEDFTMFDDNNEFDTISFEDYSESNALFTKLDKVLELQERCYKGDRLSYRDFIGLEAFLPDDITLESFKDENGELKVSNEGFGLVAAIAAIIVAIIASIIAFITGRKNKTSKEFEKTDSVAIESSTMILKAIELPPPPALPNPKEEHKVTPATVNADSSLKDIIINIASDPKRMEDIARRTKLLTKIIGEENNAFLTLITEQENYFDHFYGISNFINLQLLKRFKEKLGVLETFFKTIDYSKINENSLENIREFVIKIEKEFESRFDSVFKTHYVHAKTIERHSNQSTDLKIYDVRLSNFIQIFTDGEKDKLSSDVGINWIGIQKRIVNRKLGLFHTLKNNQEFTNFLDDKKPVANLLNDLNNSIKKVEDELTRVEKEMSERSKVDWKSSAEIHILIATSQFISSFRYVITIYSRYYKFATRVIEIQDNIMNKITRYNNEIIKELEKRNNKKWNGTNFVSNESYKTPPSFKW